MKSFIKGRTQDETIELLYIEDGKKKQIILPFNDYFYINTDDFLSIKDKLKKQWGHQILKAISYKANNGMFAKIILKNNTAKNALKAFFEDEDIKHYEADLSTTKRYLIDNGTTLKLNQSGLPYIFYDLETDDVNDFRYDDKGKVIPENTILSFAATDYQGKHFFLINEDMNNPECEKNLLIEIKKIFDQYGVVCGYNNSGFDDIYLEGRSKIYKITNPLNDVCKIDYLFSYKAHTPQDTLESYSLENVSMVELKYGKTEGVKGGGGRIRQIYLNNKLKLKEYNIQDTTLLYELNKKLKFLELHLIGAEDAVCSVDETMYNAGMNDYYALRSCKEENIVADSTPTGEEIEHRKKYNNMIGGGYTRGHLRGFFKNAWVEDFESLYPSIEISCNISAESFVANVTIDEEKQYLEWTHKGIKSFKNKEELLQYAKQYNYTITPSDKTYVAKRGKEYYHPYRFYKGDKIAILPKLMLRLIDERRALKKQEKQLEKQMTAIKDEASEEYKQIKAEWDRVHQWNISKKYVLVSNYGLQGSIYYRFFNYDVIDSITSTGRYLIKQVNELARKNGLDVIYNDTDSACLIKKENGISSDEFDKLLPGYLDEIAKGFNNTVFKRTDDKGVHTHHFGMEHEKDYDTILYVKKKRYAHCSNGKIKIVGLESTQMNVLADQIQREFLQDILLERFNKQQWKDKLDNLHKKCFGGQLTAQELSISKKYAKKITEYSGDTIDKKTGQSKIKKDGTIQIKPIPSHIELVKRMLEQGKEIFVGDKIVYIIKSTAPRQQAISIEEYEQNPTYDKEYYWGAITRPILQLMGLYMGKEVFEIIRLPEREKLLEEIKKEGGQQRTLFGEVKQSKTQERLDKLDASILENAVDENEIDDYIYPTSPTYM